MDVKIVKNIPLDEYAVEPVQIQPQQVTVKVRKGILNIWCKNNQK